jgi:RNA polymerase sigma-70 factor (ECF subfamily)
MPNVIDPDSELMLQVKAGNVQAFETLIDKYKQPITNLIARTLSDPTEAEDIAQNVFIQAYRSADRYQAQAKFSTWLYTIARNLCLNEIRRRSRHPALSIHAHVNEEGDTTESQIPDLRTVAPENQLLQTELEEMVQQALNQLPENQRSAIVMFQDQELAYEDIAKVLQCSLPATKSLIHRGRETLKKILKPYLDVRKNPSSK